MSSELSQSRPLKVRAERRQALGCLRDTRSLARVPTPSQSYDLSQFLHLVGGAVRLAKCRIIPWYQHLTVHHGLNLTFLRHFPRLRILPGSLLPQCLQHRSRQANPSSHIVPGRTSLLTVSPTPHPGGRGYEPARAGRHIPLRLWLVSETPSVNGTCPI